MGRRKGKRDGNTEKDKNGKHLLKIKKSRRTPPGRYYNSESSDEDNGNPPKCVAMRIDIYSFVCQCASCIVRKKKSVRVRDQPSTSWAGIGTASRRTAGRASQSLSTSSHESTGGQKPGQARRGRPPKSVHESAGGRKPRQARRGRPSKSVHESAGGKKPRQACSGGPPKSVHVNFIFQYGSGNLS